MPVPSSLNLKQQDDDKVAEKSASSPCNSSLNSPSDDDTNSQSKLFVGALNQETTEETLESYFKKYGEILECTIMKDSIGKKSRGFGFITFKDPGAVRDILKDHSENPIVLDQKAIDPKLAVPRKANKTATPQVRRIFIGGLSSDTDEEDMKEFFSKFGKIEEAQLMFDKHTNRHRGFGFVTFEKPGPAAKVCNIQFHDLKNKRVEVKVAQTKEALAQQADKARAAALNQSYTSAAAAFNFSPTYPQSFYPHYPLAYYGGYGYHGDHHLPSPPFFPPGFNGLPSPYFMRGLSDPSGVPLGSPDFLSDQFQSLAIMSNPYMSPTGSPPHGYPVSLTAGNFTNGGGSDAVGSNYSPPNSLSTKGNIPSDAIPPPANGYTQVPSYQPSSNTSAPLPQPAV